ncbi:MAG TPA: MFS transporter, partial [Gaiellaceae bacterium]|nr:MFS transporter [Gaiellaceae bacterium]
AALSLDRRRQLTLVATILGSALAFIDATVVIVATPTIERDLDLGLTGEQWLFLAYSLTLAALYLPAGAIGDRYGRRPVFIVGAVGFAAASAIAGAAPNELTLILARALQGVAGAFLTTNSLALLRAVYADEAGRAIGLWTSFTSVATIAGPPVGGALVEWASWRWIFFLNLPVAAAAVFFARAGRCEERRQERIGRLDIPGAVLAAIAFGSLTWGLVEGADKGFGDYWWAFAASAAAFAGFVVVERRSAEPMLPFALFRRRNFAVANLQTFLVYAALYGFFVYSTLYLQFLGFTPFETGLINIPTSAVMIFLAARFGALADRHGPRLFLTAAPLLLATGTLLFLPVADQSDFWTFGVASIAVFALGLAMLVAPITSTALKAAPSDFAGVASGVNSTVSRVGSLTAVAVIGLVITLVFAGQTADPDAVPIGRDQTDPALREASIDAFRAGMLLAAGLAVAGAAVAAVGISNAEARGEARAVSEPAAAPAES